MACTEDHLYLSARREWRKNSSGCYYARMLTIEVEKTRAETTFERADCLVPKKLCFLISAEPLQKETRRGGLWYIVLLLEVAGASCVPKD